MKSIPYVLFVFAIVAVSCSTQPTPTATDIPTLAPTEVPPTATITPTAEALNLPPIVYATTNVDCLLGTNTRYRLVIVLYKDMSAPIVGKHNDPTTGLWYWLSVSGRKCYVPADSVTQIGDLGGIPEVKPPHLPAGP